MALKKKKIIIPAIILIATVIAIILKPPDNGAPYSDYFSSVNKELKTAGPGRPALILDLDRLDTNIDIVIKTIKTQSQFRLVVKSLPSLKLVNYVLNRTGSRKIMVFHQPNLNLLAAEGMPGLDMLLGKPMPINAVLQFYRDLRGAPGFDPARQVQWLIDTPERLVQYLAFARSSGRRLRINIEIDVGLHRGGISSTDELSKMLKTISENRDILTFSGFMGYDVHASAAPAIFKSKKSAMKKALDKVFKEYSTYIEFGKKNFPDLFAGELTFNSGGSQTYRLYDGTGPANDISLGSALLKPTDFESILLEDHEPAFFIATPVLKRLKGTSIPFIEGLSGIFSLWNPNKELTYFIYGGGWMAKPVSPAGLEGNSLFGFSTNQAIQNGSEKTGLSVDDHVFFRPTQSEKVLLEFGDIWILRGRRIADRWPVFPFR